MKNFIIFPSICDEGSFKKINDIRFTQREIDVIACIISGREAKSIAQLLDISPSTVKVHLQNIKIKFGGNFKRDIIDFVEHSTQFSKIKAHYSRLLFSSIFGDALKKIRQSSLKNAQTPVTFYASKEDLPLVKQIAVDLRVAGIYSSIVQNDERHQIKGYRVQVVPQGQSPISSAPSKNNIFLSIETEQKYSLLKTQENYCIAVFHLLEIILSISLEKEILKMEEKSSKIYFSDSLSPSPKSKKKDSSFKILIISLIFVIASVWLFIFCLYKINEKYRYPLILSHIRHVEKEVQFTFDYVSHITANIGQKVSSSNYLDLKTILSALREEPITDTYLRDQFSWSFFDWIDTNDKMLASSHHEGILKTPKNMTRRQYIKKGRKSPWKLHFDLPDIGMSSGIYIIPTGMGITNKRGEYIGTVSASFNIEELTNKINDSIGHQKIKFVLIDLNENIILTSPGKEKVMKALLDKTYVQKDLKLGTYHFNHKGYSFVAMYKNIRGYPYKIVLFYRKSSVFKELISLKFVEFVILFLMFSTAISYLVFSLITLMSKRQR